MHTNVEMNTHPHKKQCSQSDERLFILHPLWYLSSLCKMAGRFITSDQGKPRESGLTPAANTSASVCVCVCVPAVIITRIRAEPNPRRVPLSPLAGPAQPCPACSSDPPVWAAMGSRAAGLPSPARPTARQIGREAKKHFFLSLKIPTYCSRPPLSYWSSTDKIKYGTSSGKTKKHKPFNKHTLLPQGCSEMEVDIAINTSGLWDGICWQQQQRGAQKK